MANPVSNGVIIVEGSADPDLLVAGDTSTWLIGNEGDDTLIGGPGDDTLDGGPGEDVLDGGAGNDVLIGGPGADIFVFRDGYDHDVILDFDLDEDRVAVSSTGVERFEDIRDRLGPDPNGDAVLTLNDGSTLTLLGVRPGELGEQHFIIEPAPVCFARGTLILTPRGAVPVEALAVGDLVLTQDAGAQPLCWIGRRVKVFGHGVHRHQPVVIPADALGRGRPARTLRLSPQHRVLLRGEGAAARSKGVLAMAKGLVGRAGIHQDSACTSIEYFQLLLPRHHILFAEGLATESFYPGPFALTTLPEADLETIAARFPGITEDPEAAYGALARPALTLRQILALPDNARLSPLLAPRVADAAPADAAADEPV